MLQEKAKRASEELGDSEFTAFVNGWLDRFKKRFNIKSKNISGEAGGVREETVTSWQERLPNILSGYSPENIFNMDETGQFFRAPLNRSLAEVSKQCTGGKKIQRKNNVRIFLLMQRALKKNRFLSASQKIRVASEQSGIRLNYPAHTSVSLKPGWILTT